MIALNLDPNRFLDLTDGRRFYPGALQRSDYNIKDIASALSKICRFSGHCKQFYSVAQHCVVGSLWIDPKFALEFLLHDAPEAYTGDVPTPIKHAFPALRRYLDKVDASVANHFGMPYPLSAEVHEMDKRMLVTEVRSLKPDVDLVDWGYADIDMLPIHPSAFRTWSPKKAEQLYLLRYHTLTGDNDALSSSFHV